MNNIKAIRIRLGVTQAEMGAGMGCTQGNVWHYEQGQTVPPEAAGKLIEFAGARGHAITFNDIYMPELAQAPANTAPQAIEAIAGQGGCTCLSPSKAFGPLRCPSLTL